MLKETLLMNTKENLFMFEEMLHSVRITACKFIMLIEIETHTEKKKLLIKAKVLEKG